jgi:hypothetical protein
MMGRKGMKKEVEEAEGETTAKPVAYCSYSQLEKKIAPDKMSCSTKCGASEVDKNGLRNHFR